MSPVQLPLGIQLAEPMSYDSFVPGPNAELLTLLRNADADVALHGPAGSGKTHLLQAACRDHRHGAYLPLDRLRSAGPALLDGFEAQALVAIDHADAVAGDAAWEQALLRLMDGVRARGHRWLAASQQPPAFALPDLRSRWASAVPYRLQGLGDADREALLQRRFGARGLQLPDEVMRYLLTRLPRDPASLVAWVDRLDTASLAARRRLTVPFVRSQLAAALDRAPANGQQATEK